jgi:hypothetical protein
MRELFIVGKVVESTDQGRVWEFQGVFSDRKKAEDHCLESDWFVGPANLDQPVPEERMEWPGCYYPKASRQSTAMQ